MRSESLKGFLSGKPVGVDVSSQRIFQKKVALSHQNPYVDTKNWNWENSNVSMFIHLIHFYRQLARTTESFGVMISRPKKLPYERRLFMRVWSLEGRRLL